MYLLVNLCLVALHMRANSAGASPIDGETLFDSSKPAVKCLKFEMPTSCANKTFCFDEGIRYPKSNVEDLLDHLPSLPFFNRVGTECAFDNECDTEDKFSTQPIYYIRDIHDQVRAVVQSPGRFEQIYSAKWCKRPGRISYDTAHFVKGSRTLEEFNVTCEESYMDFEFLVLTSDNKFEIARAKGGIPVCCKCKYHELH